MEHIFLEICTHFPWDQSAWYSAVYQKLFCAVVNCQYLFSGRLKYVVFSFAISSIFLRYGILVYSWHHILLHIFFNFILFCILQYLVSINLCLHLNQGQLYDPLLYRHCPSFHAVPKINHNSCITLLNRAIIGFHCCYISLQLLYQAYFCDQNHVKLTDKLQLYWACRPVEQCCVTQWLLKRAVPRCRNSQWGLL